MLLSNNKSRPSTIFVSFSSSTKSELSREEIKEIREKQEKHAGDEKTHS